ncbi:AEC family transporter [Aquibacillus rhizosphaerae]|uniref:AEC family transporter n=1 Tax=Aquibacillus rhizosphaerae TaxID=3051431 RepID=A0ABT7LB15_9BACI|nr:AEC family transporter [Aquibacillus sp. LR5S19]MDL4843047.1 AEC family transporter [Aquibacillus sp. LR5S19]
MDSFNQQFLYSIIIIALGYVLKRSNIMKEKDGEGLARIIFNITLPALIIVTFNGIQIEYSLFMLIAIAIVYGLFLGLLGLIVFRKEDRQTKGMLAMMVPGFNIGLFAYPLVEGIWGQEGLKYFGMFDVGNAFIVFGLSYLIGSYFSGEQVNLDFKSVIVKLSRSIPLMTYIIVCTLSIIGLHLPPVVLDVSQIISAANMPLSLLLLGIYLNFSFDRIYVNLIIKYLSLRYIIGLALGVLLFVTLPFNEMFRFTLLISFILPTSMSVVPYSVEFDYDKRFVGTTSNLTIVISFILIWIIANIMM